MILIAIGIEKIFAKSRLQFISYLTSIFLLAGALYVAFTGSLGGVNNSFFSESVYIKEYDPSVNSLKAIMELDETNLTIRDSGDDLIYGQFDRFTCKPDIEYRLIAVSYTHLTLPTN